MRFLKQSTSVDVPIGPFLDDMDAKTAETALTITQPDVRLKKNAAAWAQKAAAQTLLHEENGYYEVTLDATDTDTLGLLRLAVNESGALPVWEDFMVMPANVWDAMFGADKLQVDAVEWAGAATATDDIALKSTLAKGTELTGFNDLSAAQVNAEVDAALDTAIPGTPAANSINERIATLDNNYTAARAPNLDNLDATVSSRATPAQVNTEVDTALADYDAPTFAELDARTDAIDSAIAAVQADTNDIQTRLPAALVGGRMDADMTAISGDSGAADTLENELDLTAGSVPTRAIVERGTAQAGANGSITLRAGASATDDLYNNDVIYIRSGTGAGQSRTIVDYVGSTKVATVEPVWGTNPDATSQYDIFPAPPAVTTAAFLPPVGEVASLGPQALAELNTEVDTALADIHLDHLLAVDYDPANKPGVATALLNELVESDGGVSRYTANALEQAPTGAGGDGSGFTAIPWNAAWDAEVQSEVTDALNVYDPPTKAELDAAVAPLATAAALDAVDNFVDTEVTAIKGVTDKLDTALELDGAVYRYTTNALENAPVGGGGGTDWTAGEKEQIRHRLGLDGTASAPAATPSLATAAAVAAVQADTDNMQTRLPAALVGGRIAANAEVVGDKTGYSLATAPLDAAATRAALGLAAANLDTQLDALPTNAELTVALAAADDAVLAQVALVKAKTDTIPAAPAAVSDIPSAAANASAVLAAATSTPIAANIEQVNGIQLVGTGVIGDEWVPV